MKALRLLIFLNAAARIAASSAIHDFFAATAALESVFQHRRSEGAFYENCPNGSIYDTISSDSFSVCTPFKNIAEKIASAGTAGRVKSQIYLELCNAGSEAECMQIENLLVQGTMSSPNDFGCETFFYTNSRRHTRGRVLQLKPDQEVQVSLKACLDETVDKAIALISLYAAFVSKLDIIGPAPCVKETEFLEREGAIRSAFQKIPLSERAPQAFSFVPVIYFVYGDASSYEWACTNNGGRFVNLKFRATCKKDDEEWLIDVMDRPRCYSWSCSDESDDALFQRYTIGPTEAVNGPRCTCTGNLLTQTNAAPASRVFVTSAPSPSPFFESTSTPVAFQPASPIFPLTAPVVFTANSVSQAPVNENLSTITSSPVANTPSPVVATDRPVRTLTPVSTPVASSSSDGSSAGKLTLVLLGLLILGICFGACFFLYRRHLQKRQVGDNGTRDLEKGKKDHSSNKKTTDSDSDDSDSDDSDSDDSDFDSDDDSDKDSDSDDDSDKDDDFDKDSDDDSGKDLDSDDHKSDKDSNEDSSKDDDSDDDKSDDGSDDSDDDSDDGSVDDSDDAGNDSDTS